MTDMLSDTDRLLGMTLTDISEYDRQCLVIWTDCVKSVGQYLCQFLKIFLENLSFFKNLS